MAVPRARSLYIRANNLLNGRRNDTQIRVFHKTDNEDGYKPLRFILQDKDEYKKLLERCLYDLRNLKKKYQNLSEYQEIWDLIH